MFKQLGLHVIDTPTGRFIYVGAVPSALGEEVPATAADVMAGRAFENARGAIVTIKFPSFETEAEAITFAALHGFEARLPIKGGAR